MGTPQPTEDIVAARSILRSAALPASERRLRIPTETIERLAAAGVTRSLEILGAVPPAHAGWALLLTGVRIARSSDVFAPPSPGRRADTSFGVGLVWGALVIAVAGDQLIASADELPSDDAWEPGSDGPEVTHLAQKLVETMFDSAASVESRDRFAADSISGLDEGLAGLDHRPAGWMLCTFATWMASNITTVATPMARRRSLGLRRVTNPKAALGGSGFSAALLAETGRALLGSAHEDDPGTPR